MTQPINYMAAMPQIDLSQSFAGLGKALGEYRDYQEQQKKDQAAADLKMQYADDVKAYFAKPSASGLSMLTAKYPGQREAFKDIGDRMSAEQKAVELPVMAQAFHAITTGKPDAAKLLVDQQIEGMQNSGMDATKLKMIRSQLDSDPTQVAGLIGLVGSSIDPDGWGKMMGEKRAQDLQPSLVRKGVAEAGAAESDTSVKAAKAKYAESEVVLDLEKKGWDIKKIKEDIDINKQNARIAAMNASLAKEGNALKRQELQMKMDDAKTARDEKVRGKVAEVESARSSIDNFLNTTDRAMKMAIKHDSNGNPMLDKSGKPIPSDTLRALAGPIDAMTPTIQRDVADLEELLKQIGSQAFIGQVKQVGSMSGLTEKEGDKIQNSFSSLSPRQSPEALLYSLQEGSRLMMKGRKGLAQKYGVPESVPDTPAVKPSPKDVDAMVNELLYGGK